jgi:putative addiction module killer protein
LEPGYEVLEYIDPHGAMPVRAWLSELRDLRGRAKILVRLRRVALGNLGRHRSVGGGVMELIVDSGPGYRIYFALTGLHSLLLLAMGSKRSQRRDIPLAQRRWNDFKSRNAAMEFSD